MSGWLAGIRMNLEQKAAVSKLEGSGQALMSVRNNADWCISQLSTEWNLAENAGNSVPFKAPHRYLVSPKGPH